MEPANSKGPAPYPSPGVPGEETIDADRAAIADLLRQFISIPSVSGQERAFTEFVADWAGHNGFEIDLWQAKEADVAKLAPLPPKFIPLNGRPTLVIRLPGTGGGRSLMFNAHSDVVAAPQPEQWRFGPWSGATDQGRMYGRGACDVKGPLVSALWAMRAIQRLATRPAGDILLELIPGEEDSVGLGTLTSIARGYKTDGVVILEPTEGMPRCASRGGLRFEISCLGKAVHGTVKWLGDDAITTMRKVLDSLEKLESRWNDRAADPLFVAYPLIRPITVDYLNGGQWQGMVCDRCTCGGYLELLPGDDINLWKKRCTESLLADLSDVDIQPSRIEVRFVEHYDGHFTPPDSPICRTAVVAFGHGTNYGTESPVTWNGWSGFNSGCEAGMRARLLATPTLVWGPGSLAQAHAVDEFVDLEDIRVTAARFAAFATEWSGNVAAETR